MCIMKKHLLLFIFVEKLPRLGTWQGYVKLPPYCFSTEKGRVFEWLCVLRLTRHKLPVSRIIE